MYFALIVWIGLLIHELGRLPVAWVLRARPTRVRFGLGKPIKRWTRGSTEYQLAPIPIGIFFRYPGNVPGWKRVLTILSGPTWVYGSASVLLAAVTYCHGVVEKTYYQVQQTQEGFDAHGKLEPGDLILSVDDVPVQVFRGPSLIEVIQRSHRKGQPLRFSIRRGGTDTTIQITPTIDRTMRRITGVPAVRIGVMLQPHEVRARPGLTRALEVGLAEPARALRRHASALFTRNPPEGELTGPVGINAALDSGLKRSLGDTLALAAWTLLYLVIMVFAPLALVRFTALAVNRDNGYL